MQQKRILIMGLPGSGKTTLAGAIMNCLQEVGKTVSWYNADIIRKNNIDWDFSENGRLRQAYRMKSLSDSSLSEYVISDFVAPLPKMREIFNPHYLIFMNTIQFGRFNDTNSLFQPPKESFIEFTEFDSEQNSKFFVNSILLNT